MSRFKKNNPGCCGCEGLPCGPNQVICNNFSPKRYLEYVDVTISGIPNEIERDRIITTGTRDNSIITGLAQANGTYRNLFDLEECAWESVDFFYTITDRCRQFGYPPGVNNCSATTATFDFSVSNTLKVNLFGGGGGSVTVTGVNCTAGGFPGFNFPAFDKCDPDEQTETVTVSYNQCVGGSITSVSFTVTVKFQGSYALL